MDIKCDDSRFSRSRDIISGIRSTYPPNLKTLTHYEDTKGNTKYRK